jgi:tetratricopeptide (TPR) repeat protein
MATTRLRSDATALPTFEPLHRRVCPTTSWGKGHLRPVRIPVIRHSLGVGALLLAVGLALPASVAASEEALQRWHEAHVSIYAEESLEHYRRIITDSEDDSLVSMARLERLKGLYSLGRTEQAMTEWYEWMAQQPDLPIRGERLYWFTLVLLDLGKVGEAAYALEDALAAGAFGMEETAHATALRELLIACHLELDEPGRAAQVAMETVRQTRSDDLMPLLLYDLARAHEAGGNYDKAQETWKLLRDSYPSTPEATYAEAEIISPPQDTDVLPPALPSGEDNEATYLLFIRSFPSMAQATSLADDAEELGIPVRIDELEAPSGPLFSVVAGPVVGQRSAERVKRELISVLGIPGIVILEQPTGETTEDRRR